METNGKDQRKKNSQNSTGKTKNVGVKSDNDNIEAIGNIPFYTYFANKYF
jgi:hypothetical protein